MSHVLSQLFPAIECVFEHIVVEIVDDVFGHVENGEPDEEWHHHLFTGVFNLTPIRFSEYMVIPATLSYPYFLIITSRSFHVVANFTFIRFNLVSTNLHSVNYANN